MIDVTPDEIPVIGPIDGMPGLVIATGLSGHGFGIGPGVGYLAAQLAVGREPIVDPDPFRYDRFSPEASRRAAETTPVSLDRAAIGVEA
jgi:glycine/D-amino acid oxidase-like deaminating enzyme